MNIVSIDMDRLNADISEWMKVQGRTQRPLCACHKCAVQYAAEIAEGRSANVQTLYAGMVYLLLTRMLAEATQQGQAAAPQRVH